MNTHFEFRSKHFPPLDGEEESINPGCYGKSLAIFISNRLSLSGIKTWEPSTEDWGWYLPLSEMGFNAWIGCGAVHESINRFLCFIYPDRASFWHLGKKKRVEDGLRRLSAAMIQALSDEKIEDLKLYTYDEYKKGA